MFRSESTHCFALGKNPGPAVRVLHLIQVEDDVVKSLE
jgi:hypothetical protein